MVALGALALVGTGSGPVPLSGQTPGVTAPPAPAPCADPAPSWIWCDDFEQNRLSAYFERRTDGGRLRRVEGAGRGGSTGLEARWDRGSVSAGALHLAFGRTPSTYFHPVDDGLRDHHEVYVRVYLRLGDAWTGGTGRKLLRAIVFADDRWAQAAVGHVWGGPPTTPTLVLDPASGTDPAGTVRTRHYNDLDRFRWLGGVASKHPVFDPPGQRRCLEVRMRLNDPGVANGVFALWVDGTLAAERTDLDWVGRYRGYGINAVFIENYWDGGSPAPNSRILDELVVSPAPVGCTAGVTLP